MSSRVIVALTEALTPTTIIVHGSEATRGLGQVLGRDIEPADLEAPVRWFRGRPTIVAIPSLSPPRSSAWLLRAKSDLRRMAEELRRHVSGGVATG
jgi:hypothetical protein